MIQYKKENKDDHKKRLVKHCAGRYVRQSHDVILKDNFFNSKDNVNQHTCLTQTPRIENLFHRHFKITCYKHHNSDEKKLQNNSTIIIINLNYGLSSESSVNTSNSSCTHQPDFHLSLTQPPKQLSGLLFPSRNNVAETWRAALKEAYPGIPLYQ